MLREWSNGWFFNNSGIGWVYDVSWVNLALILHCTSNDFGFPLCFEHFKELLEDRPLLVLIFVLPVKFLEDTTNGARPDIWIHMAILFLHVPVLLSAR